MSDTLAARLQGLGLQLPDCSTPAANYVPWVRTGNLLFISGQVPKRDGEDAYIGKLGDEFGIEDGQAAARLCALNILAHLNDAVEGDASRVRRCVRLGGFVNSTPAFDQHPKVINGASDLMVDVLGVAGKHARAAVGVAALPRNVAVEVDAIFEID
ncbi:L-PSP family endoribonuclease [Pandoraea terrae]|uniref:L-PSP family endoribonuclease n=1 Tax=Pandoraea terrae TaxID=1537710 RepID=A0A5E4WDL7_9BURK|nr:RidA family protein [Pandoraea terrae]VVE22922.1 L-PSP family endoribonuclease [Pandoraea terrae]